MAHPYSRKRNRIHGWTCAVALLLQAPLAAAEPTPPERETARALMTEGDKLRAQGDLRGALTRYQAAHAIMHAPTTGLDLARVQAQLGLLVEARSTATEVVHLPETAHEPRVFTTARTDALALANELESRIPAFKTEVQPSHVNYHVSVDGIELPEQAQNLPFRANPGSHSLRVEAAGYVTDNRQITLTDGELQIVSIALTAVPVATPGPNIVPITPSPRPTPLTDERDTNERGDAARIRGVIGLSVGGVALALGSATGIMSLVQTSDIKVACPNSVCTPSHRGAVSSANTLANVSNISLPLGLIGIAYGLFEMITAPSSTPPRATAARTTLEINGSGVTVRGSL